MSHFRSQSIIAFTLFIAVTSFIPRTNGESVNIPRAPKTQLRTHELIDSNWRFYLEPTVTNPLRGWGDTLKGWQFVRLTGPISPDKVPQSLSDLGDIDGVWAPAKVDQDVFNQEKGFALLRTSLPVGTKLQSIHFGGIDDNAWVYINGQLVKTNVGWDTPFDVPVEGLLKSDAANVVTILDQNTNGGGGLSGPVFLQYGAAPTPTESSETFNDSKWRIVHLPHDYVVEGQFDPNGDVGHGSLPHGSAWYRKTLNIPASDYGRDLWIDFDGVYRDAQVWFNGHPLGEHLSGYAGFRFDITKYAKLGASNILAVHVDASENEGWFYEGGGIYRHVWLTSSPATHISPAGGVYVTSDIAFAKPGAASAQINIATKIENSAKGQYSVVSTVIRPDGVRLPLHANVFIASGSDATPMVVNSSIVEPRAQLWSLENPQLYTLISVLYKGAKPIDFVVTQFGLRTIHFDANKGLFLNGKPVKIQGTCNHQDFAGVGSALPDSVFDWRVRQLKAMGCNAYRTSHNEVASALLDACDREGMLVMDENRHFGDTQAAKASDSTPASDLTDLKQMIMRDRNHPSVILWSIANEEFSVQSDANGQRIGKAMRAAVLALDSTRPITAAMNGGQFARPGLAPELDVVGFNYNPSTYAPYHTGHTSDLMMGSETSSEVTTRSEYSRDPVKGYVPAYDVEDAAVNWGQSAEDAWEPLARDPYMAGGFVWTGFDYRGEPTPYAWPDISSNFGILDMCGFPKDIYYYYQSVWLPKPMVHIMPHWNWAVAPKTPIPVWAFSNADSVELFLNGVSLGKKAMPKYRHLEWSVPYQRGTLIAKAYDAGKLVATDTVSSTGPSASIVLRSDRTKLIADGEDATMVMVDILDSKGLVVPTASNKVKFTIVGPAHVDGVGNGDPSCHEPDKASQRSAFNGHCLAVVQSDEDKTGYVTFTATSPGLKSATLKLYVVH